MAVNDPYRLATRPEVVSRYERWRRARNVVPAMIETDRRDAALRATLPGGSERAAAQG